MLRTRIIPVLLISKGKLVKTVKFKNPKYIGDPINAIKQFNEYGADEICVLNIDRTPPDAKYIQRISDECNIPFSYGGGIRTVDDARMVINNGAEKVIIRTHNEIIKDCARIFGAQSVVKCVDYKEKTKWFMFNRFTDQAMIEYVNTLPIGEIIVQCIDRDGVMDGYDLETIKRYSKISNVPVIALGGAGTIDHLREAKEAGADAVAAGSMFVYSKKGGGILISYPNREEVNI